MNIDEFIEKRYEEASEMLNTIKQQAETIRLLREDGEKLAVWAKEYKNVLEEKAMHSRMLWGDIDQHTALLKQLDEQEKK